jgi:signal transduction histidine kinase
MPGDRDGAGHDVTVVGTGAKAEAKLDDQASHPISDLVPGTDRLFESVLNRLPMGVVVVDGQLRIVYSNPAAHRLLDLAAPLQRGDPLPDPWQQFSLRSLAESLFSHQPESRRHLVEAGEHIVCVDGFYAGHMPTATLVFEDVTERERTRNAERRFVENAAHELRTPLAAITSVVDVLESGAKDEPETRDRFLAHIRFHSDRLVRLATSLLTLARIQTGHEPPHLDLVPLEPLLNEVAAGLTLPPGVEVRVDAPRHLAVLADRDFLCQVMENLAVNAAGHTREGSIVFAARDLGRMVEIELADTGTGMNRRDASHAFDRFYRSPENNGEGFGLGLAIAQDAIRALNGTIRLDSAPGIGTRVRIGLPSARLVP